MNKEEIQFKKIANTEKNIDSLIDLHKLIYDNTSFENRLIFYDDAFAGYLKSIVIEGSQNNWWYGLFDEDNLVGFIHLRLINSFLFLNNISVHPDYSGQGLGRSLLYNALSELKSLSPIEFELDVFSKNLKAKSWYDKLGFKQIKKKYWYNIVDELDSSLQNHMGLSEAKDENGFDSLFIDSSKIATVVGGKTLILHDLSYLSRIYKGLYENIVYISEIKIENRPEFKLIDTSLRMRTFLNEVLVKI